MSRLLIGNWVHRESGVKATIRQKPGQANGLDIVFSDRRGPFVGSSDDSSYQTVINVDFSDDAAFTGVLAADRRKIYWANGTEWERVMTRTGNV